MLEARGIRVAAHGKEILHGIDAIFPEGKRTAIIGPNGAGKSTLLSVLSGQRKPSGGKALLDGQDIQNYSRKALARKLAILPQGLSAPGDLTVEGLVSFGRAPYQSWISFGSNDEDKEAIEHAMQETKIEPLRRREVMTLSGGERQRAWIAMALAQGPSYLLLDEPTTYLDIAHQLEVMNIVSRLKKELAMTIVMVLHDINHALQYADEILVIKQGRVFAQGAPQEVLTPKLLAGAFGVQAEFFTNSQGARVLSPVALAR